MVRLEAGEPSGYLEAMSVSGLYLGFSLLGGGAMGVILAIPCGTQLGSPRSALLPSDKMAV